MIKIDTVYQKVLAIANKEQRGYITPQEFNLFADHAQKEIFEQYFYDLNQFKRIPGNDSNYADMVDYLENKISVFTDSQRDVTVLDDYGYIDVMDEIEDLYRITQVAVRYSGAGDTVVAEELNQKDFSAHTKLMRRFGDSQSKKRPVYLKSGNIEGALSGHVYKGFNIQVFPFPSSDISVDQVKIFYIRTPKKPEWNYQIVNEKPFFLNGQNFELHPSEESELVYRILALAGVHLEKPQLVQTAMALEGAKVSQEKI
jgi:hypothetical protein